MNFIKDDKGQEGRKYGPLVFIHLPKTAGASLIAGLLKQYDQKEIFHIRNLFPLESLERFQALTQEDRSHIRLLAGHHAHLFDQELKEPLIACMFRDPVKQFLSARSHLLRSAFNPRYKEVIGLNGLGEYIEWAEQRGFTNNQTYYLSHSDADLHRSRVQDRQVNFDDLSKACDRLQLMDMPMIAEELEVSIGLLCTLMHWSEFELEWRNKSPKSETQLPDPEQIERIRQLQWADNQLYQAALERNARLKEELREKMNLLQPVIKRRRSSNWWMKWRFYLGLEDTSWMKPEEKEKGRTS